MARDDSVVGCRETKRKAIRLRADMECKGKRGQAKREGQRGRADWHRHEPGSYGSGRWEARTLLEGRKLAPVRARLCISIERLRLPQV